MEFWRSETRDRRPGLAVSANLLMVPLEPLELLDHHPAGRKSVGIFVSESARQKNLGKAGIRSLRLVRILWGGNDKVMDHFSGALDALNRDAAALSIAEEIATGFSKQGRIGRLGQADTHEPDNRN